MVRDTGETNMFDVTAVTKIALKMGFLELAEYLQNHKMGENFRTRASEKGGHSQTGQTEK